MPTIDEEAKTEEKNNECVQSEGTDEMKTFEQPASTTVESEPNTLEELDKLDVILGSDDEATQKYLEQHKTAQSPPTSSSKPVALRSLEDIDKALSSKPTLPPAPVYEHSFFDAERQSKVLFNVPEPHGLRPRVSRSSGLHNKSALQGEQRWQGDASRISGDDVSHLDAPPSFLMHMSTAPNRRTTSVSNLQGLHHHSNTLSSRRNDADTIPLSPSPEHAVDYAEYGRRDELFRATDVTFAAALARRQATDTITDDGLAAGMQSLEMPNIDCRLVSPSHPLESKKSVSSFHERAMFLEKMKRLRVEMTFQDSVRTL